MSEKTLRHVVVPRTLCFVFCGDDVLLIRASQEKDWQGMFDPIGGHIEKGEDVVESANREIKEEAGLTVTDTKLRGVIHVSNFFGKEIMLFITQSFTTNKEVHPSHEGIPQWVKVTILEKVKVFADVKPIIEMLGKLKPDQLFTGISVFDGKEGLVSIKLSIK